MRQILLFLFLIPSLVFAKDYGDINARGQFKIKSTACLDVSGGTIYHDTNCNGTKNSGEEYIDSTGGGGSSYATSADLAADLSDETGTGSVVYSNSPGLVTPSLGTPSSVTLTNATGLPVSTGISGLGTGVATFLGSPSSANLASALTNETGSGFVVFSTSPTLTTPALGTPSAAVLTNATGLPISTGLTGAASNVLTWMATPSSANLLAAVTDETGSGAAVFATSPTLVTPALGTPSSALLTNATGLPLSTGVTGTLDYANGGTGLTAASDDNVMVGSGLGWQSKTLTTCTGSDKAITYDASTNSFGCNTITTAGTTWGAITGNITTQNWQSTAAFLPRGSVNWTDMQNYSGSINWGDTDMYAKSWNSSNNTLAGVWQLLEASANGNNYINWKAPDSLASNIQWTLPSTDKVGPLQSDGAGTLTWGPRTNTTTSSATPSINTDTTDIFTITALATAITSMTTNLSGTPVNGQKLTIRIKDDGTARAITWGASFASRGATLPTTTVISKYLYVGLIWNSTASTWDCVATAQEI